MSGEREKRGTWRGSNAMSSFSEREGIRLSPSSAPDALEPGLRNRLWNAVRACYFSSVAWTPELDTLVHRLWDEHFKRPLDSIAYANVLKSIRDYYFQAEWFEVYDFVEFCSMAYPDPAVNANFHTQANTVLEQERAAYRFVSGRLVRITSGEEILAVERALDTSRSIPGVHERLRRALELLADRRKLNCPGAIRQSLYAVETLRQLSNGNGHDYFYRAAQVLESPALSPTFGRLFSGLSHYRFGAKRVVDGAGRNSEVGFDDAKLALVTCSALVNYVLARSSPKKAWRAEAGDTERTKQGGASVAARAAG